MNGLTLVTRGYIDELNTGLAACIRPEVQGILEVRPRIRKAKADDQDVDVPLITAASDLRPGMVASVPAPPDPGVTPVNTSLSELRPVIRKVEE